MAGTQLQQALLFGQQIRLRRATTTVAGAITLKPYGTSGIASTPA